MGVIKFLLELNTLITVISGIISAYLAGEIWIIMEPEDTDTKYYKNSIKRLKLYLIIFITSATVYLLNT